MYVCVCNGVTDRDVREVVDAGCRSVAELTMRTGAGAGCGSCLEAAAAFFPGGDASAVELPVLPLAAAA